MKIAFSVEILAVLRFWEDFFNFENIYCGLIFFFLTEMDRNKILLQGYKVGVKLMYMSRTDREAQWNIKGGKLNKVN